MDRSVIEMTVRSHPGSVLHVTSLLVRRGFYLEGMLCGPLDDDRMTRVLLLIRPNERIEQLIKELGMLEDALAIHRRADINPRWFREAIASQGRIKRASRVR